MHGRGCGAPRRRRGRAHGLGTSWLSTGDVRPVSALALPGASGSVSAGPAPLSVRPWAAAPSVADTTGNCPALRALGGGGHSGRRTQQPPAGRTDRDMARVPRRGEVHCGVPHWPSPNPEFNPIYRVEALGRSARRAQRGPWLRPQLLPTLLPPQGVQLLGPLSYTPNRAHTCAGLCRPSPAGPTAPGASSPHSDPRPLRGTDRLPVDLPRPQAASLLPRMPPSGRLNH